MNDATMTMTVPTELRPTDLVLEVQRRRRATAKAKAEVRRRQRRTTALHSAAIIAATVLLACAGKISVDYVRMDRALTSANTLVSDETPESLEQAVTWLSWGLDTDPDAPDGRSMLAFVRAQQAIDGSVSTDEVRAALDGAREGPQTAIARSILAVLEGHPDRAGDMVAELEPDELDTAVLQRALWWVRGQIEVHQLGDPTRIAAAIEAIEASHGAESSWDRTHRVAAALYFRAGRLDEAGARLDEALRLRPADTGVAVDRVLFDAVTRTRLHQTRAKLDTLLQDPSLRPRDAARARLAAGMLALRGGEDNAQTQLNEAYRALHPMDHLARMLALEVALRHHATDLASRWIDSGELPKDVSTAHRAWIALLLDQPSTSLEQLATLPQGPSQVALVQGLALLEQGRNAEAHPFVQYAAHFLPNRPMLWVAQARTDGTLNNAGAAAEKLESIARRHPHTLRVWTGLAEALIAADGGRVPASAEFPLRKALAHEPVPAQAAFLLGLRLRDLSVDDPAKISDAIDSLRRAADLRPWAPTLRETLGLTLADAGDRIEALDLLHSVADAPSTAPGSLLVLAELAAKADRFHDEREQWLESARTRGATVDALLHTQARIDIESTTTEDITRVKGTLEQWLADHPRDIEARLVHVEALRRLGDLDGARASVRAGFRSNRRHPLGRLMLAWAQVEHDAGRDRRAASLAGKGWNNSLHEQRPTNELLDAAKQTIEAWRAVERDGSALLVGRQLTRQVPHRAESWVMRSRTQLATAHPGPACASARRAASLDASFLDAHRALAECSAALGDVQAERTARNDLASLMESAGPEGKTMVASRFSRK
ncbi:MAG: hypothetical protein K0V04_28120 [Deltaproteobacteria bacterium]|nr:hypothetical protein [Deltaproteobacteria bacterium]